MECPPFTKEELELKSWLNLSNFNMYAGWVSPCFRYEKEAAEIFYKIIKMKNRQYSQAELKKKKCSLADIFYSMILASLRNGRTKREIVQGFSECFSKSEAKMIWALFEERLKQEGESCSPSKQGNK